MRLDIPSKSDVCQINDGFLPINWEKSLISSQNPGLPGNAEGDGAADKIVL